MSSAACLQICTEFALWYEILHVVREDDLHKVCVGVGANGTKPH